MENLKIFHSTNIKTKTKSLVYEKPIILKIDKEKTEFGKEYAKNKKTLSDIADKGTF